LGSRKSISQLYTKKISKPPPKKMVKVPLKCNCMYKDSFLIMILCDSKLKMNDHCIYRIASDIII